MDGGRRRTFTMRPDGFSWEDSGEGLLLEKSTLVPSSLAPMVPILRAANQIEERTCVSPLVLCRSSGGGQSGGRIYVVGGGSVAAASGSITAVGGGHGRACGVLVRVARQGERPPTRAWRRSADSAEHKSAGPCLPLLDPPAAAPLSV